MKTKVVYVLTCAENAHYIEQAAMAVWSMRMHNSNAYIVIIVDDKTNLLLNGKRGEWMQFVNERVVVSFDADKTMKYRSRWLKTSVRNLIDGDFLFVDCDTICMQSICEVDLFDMEIGAVLDEHMPLKEYPNFLQKYIQKYAEPIEYQYNEDTHYFNSGVMYVKDTANTRAFYNTWHEEWLMGESKGVDIDQPSLGKTNLNKGHLIREIDGAWNTLVFMRPMFIDKAKILHFWGLRNVSLMYSNAYLNYVQCHGIDAYVESCICNAVESLIPFPCLFSNMGVVEFYHAYRKIYKQLFCYVKDIDPDLVDFPWKGSFNDVELRWVRHGLCRLASINLVMRKFVKIVVLEKKDHRIVSFP